MRTHLSRVLILASATVLFVGGCGGSGGGSEPSDPTITINSTPTVDGTVVDTFFASTGSFALQVGDTGVDAKKRGFLRFSLAPIPTGATIVSVVLRVHQSVVHGTPYASLGDVEVHHMRIGAALDLGDFGTPAVVAGTLSSDPALEYKTLDVTTSVAADLAAALTDSDFRLVTSILDTDSDGVEDDTRWNDGEDTFGTGNVPHLVVAYSP